MPKFNVTDEEAGLLADYIMTVYQTPVFDRDEIEASKVSAAEASRGKDLYYGKYACNSCHILDPDKDKGYIGPTLTQVGLRLNAAWIFHWLKDAQALRPGTMELNWNMNDDDARAITAFLIRTEGGSQGRSVAMKRALVALALLAAAGCRRVPSSVPAASAIGVAIVDIGGELQVAGAGAALDQPVRATPERRQIVHGLNAIIHVLQPVRQLAAGHQLFVKNERQRLRHAPSLEFGPEKSKNFRAVGKHEMTCPLAIVPRR